MVSCTANEPHESIKNTTISKGAARLRAFSSLEILGKVFHNRPNETPAHKRLQIPEFSSAKKVKKPPVCAAKQGKPFERKGYNQSPDTVHQFGVVVKTSRKCNNDEREETPNFLRVFKLFF